MARYKLWRAMIFIYVEIIIYCSSLWMVSMRVSPNPMV